MEYTFTGAHAAFRRPAAVASNHPVSTAMRRKILW
jgi:hypothetical protein